MNSYSGLHITCLANIVFMVSKALQYVNKMRHSVHENSLSKYLGSGKITSSKKKNPRGNGDLFCRDDWIRTSDHTPPRRVRYRAALRPENGSERVSRIGGATSRKINRNVCPAIGGATSRIFRTANVLANDKISKNSVQRI